MRQSAPNLPAGSVPAPLSVLGAYIRPPPALQLVVIERQANIPLASSPRAAGTVSRSENSSSIAGERARLCW